ncbi:hypothetical protein TcWFU_003533 [Taenia crassiceps]|uniref:Coiled-coil domain-containing protein n=1 Tax=Taenia crassiceps TaxID=6207 RepID=A0ABR4Q4Z0_9CEST
MPKKFGTNTKSQEAREKKEAAKELQKAKQAKAEEDAYWEDNDKHVNRKLQRKREAKRLEAIKKKQELRKLHDEEMSSLQGASSKIQTSNPNKLTQAQIAAARERLNAQLASLAPKKEGENLPLTENPNRIADDVIEARTVEDAIKALNVTSDSPTEKHPERRLKAAYLAYEEKMLPQLRKEYPGMRHSQLTQMIFKSFQTAPENPKNQAHKQYNEK